MTRPTFSKELLDLVERTSDPTIRSKLKIAQDRWDRQRGKRGNAKSAPFAAESSKRPRKRRFKPYWRD
jgi:hypothetical protein